MKASWIAAFAFAAITAGGTLIQAEEVPPAAMKAPAAVPATTTPKAAPKLADGEEMATLTYAPEVPPAITRKTPAVVKVELETKEAPGVLMDGFNEPTKYPFWTFNGRVPGPFIRARQGDTLELTLKNNKDNTMPHNIDLHAVTGPGGGAAITLVQPGESKTVRFKLLNAGLFVYHCAAPPVTDHIANGMYGMILVEPMEGLPKVNKEFYVLQSEFYTKEEMGTEGIVSFDRKKAEEEEPTYVVFNGKVGSMQEKDALQAKVGDRVRIYFGNAGPNKISSFHVIGAIFERVYREGGFGEEQDHNIQTTLVPAGGAAIAEIKFQVPGAYTMLDHSIFRLEKGAVGTINVSGAPAPSIYSETK